MRHKLLTRKKILILLAILALGVCSASFAQAPNKKKTAKDLPPRQVTDFTTKKAEEKKADEGQSPAQSAQASESDITTTGSEPAKKAEGDLYSYDKPEVEESSYGWLFFKTIIVLGLFGVGFYFFFKYVSKKSGLVTIGTGVATILSVVPIGQNKFIQVVDIGGKVLVLGVTDNSISLITELKDRDEIERVRLLSSKTTPVVHHGFQDFVTEQVSSLVDFIGRTKKGLEKRKEEKRREPVIEEYIDDDHVDYLRNQRERLRKLNGHNGENNDR